ncbi:MAG: ATP-dependent helicase [Candidatus Kerfeldbacteria bacterium]|nr:ATP-dependent helicase [Candidatus Kerfeldbacteria bacterium]
MGSEFDVHYALLNPEQRRAVDHVDGPMLVLAGAGTGKTQMIALRIAKLLATQDLEPRNILCLTFTESGVNAMRARLVTMLGAVGYQVRVYTFHGFCNEVITDHPEVFLEQSALEPITDLDRIIVVQDIIQELSADNPLKPFGAPDFYIPDILRAIQTLKRENVSPDQLLKLVDDTMPDKKNQKQLAKQRALVGVYQAYQTKLRQLQQYDYEDMILYVIQAFTDHPDILADYQEQYLYVLVDEFQDTNGAQNEVIRLLGSNQTDPNIFVVGDDRQSIYRFQGAALENILSFQQRYGQSAEIISLQQNYRSQQMILDAATALIRNNQSSLERHIPTLQTGLIAARALDPYPIEIAALDSPAVELYWLSQRITALIAEGCNSADIAVICRTNADADVAFDHLNRSGIPVHLAAGSNVLADPFVQQFVRLLSYVGLGGNDEELFSISQSDWLQFPLAEVAVLTHQASSTHTFLWQVWQNSEQPAIHQFAENILRWRRVIHTQLCSDWFSMIVQESGWLAHVMKTQHSVAHLNRLSTLFHAVLQLTRSNHRITIKEVLEYLRLLQKHDLALEEEPLATQRQAVHVYTGHRAKGLEFQHVFIIKCVDKHWGNTIDRAKLKLPAGILQFESADVSTAANEDERRLLYVAMTRAKEKLYMSFATQSDSGRATQPSQFISELPSATVTPALDAATVIQQPGERLVQTLSPAPERLDTAVVQDYVRGLLANYRMSATHLNDYLHCPRLFFYQDILRVPHETNKQVAFGIAVHNALQAASRQQIDHGHLPAVTDFMQVFEKELTKQPLSTKDYQHDLAFGQSILPRYYADHQDILRANLFPEKNFSSDQIMVDEVPLVGKIDSITVLDEATKQVHVIDYKTSNPDSKSADLAKGGVYHRQLLFYKLLCDNAKAFGYTAVSGEINFVRPSAKTNQFVHRQYEFTDEDVARTRQEIKVVYQHIQNLDFLHPAAEALCGECNWCQLLDGSTIA